MEIPINLIKDAILLFSCKLNREKNNIKSIISVSKTFKKITINSQLYINKTLDIAAHCGPAESVLKLSKRGGDWNSVFKGDWLNRDFHIFQPSDGNKSYNFDLTEYDIIRYLSTSGQISQYVDKILLQEKITYDDVWYPWAAGSACDFSLTSFKSLMKVLDNLEKDKITDIEYMFDNIENMKISVIEDIIMISIANNNYKLFKYMHSQNDIKKYIYSETGNEDFIINIISENREYWLDIVEFNKDIYSMIEYLRHASEINETLLPILLNKIFDNYDIIPYEIIAPYVSQANNSRVFYKFINHGCDIDTIKVLINTASRGVDEPDILFQCIESLGLIDNIEIQRFIEDIILRGGLNTKLLIRYYKITSRTPDNIVQKYLKF